MKRLLVWKKYLVQQPEKVFASFSQKSIRDGTLTTPSDADRTILAVEFVFSSAHCSLNSLRGIFLFFFFFSLSFHIYT